MPESTDRVFLAIDFGERRVGLAKSDPMGIIASSLATLEVRSTKDALEQLAAIISEHAPSALIVGYPELASGTKSEKCKDVDAFIEKLEAIYSGPIYRVDEGYSSVEAARIIHAHGAKSGKDKGRIDRLAAVIILQRFLDEHPSGRELPGTTD